MTGCYICVWGGLLDSLQGDCVDVCHCSHEVGCNVDTSCGVWGKCVCPMDLGDFLRERLVSAQDSPITPGLAEESCPWIF